MGLQLADKFKIVRDTFAEADSVMTPDLGRPLTDYIAAKVHDTQEASLKPFALPRSLSLQH